MKFSTEDSRCDLEKWVKHNYLLVEINNTVEEDSKFQNRINIGIRCMAWFQEGSKIKNL